MRPLSSAVTTGLLPPMAMMAALPVSQSRGRRAGRRSAGRESKDDSEGARLPDWCRRWASHAGWVAGDPGRTQSTATARQPHDRQRKKGRRVGAAAGDAPGGRMASKLSTPNMPRLEMTKVPVVYSSGDSCLPRARLTCAGARVEAGRGHGQGGRAGDCLPVTALLQGGMHIC